MRLHSAIALSSVALLSTTTTAYAWNSQPNVARRAFLVQAPFAAWTTITVAGSSEAPVVVETVKADTESEQAKLEARKKEKERQLAQREARKIAEDTKKRLAVGRIGTI
jgi:hypothetical protein